MIILPTPLRCLNLIAVSVILRSQPQQFPLGRVKISNFLAGAFLVSLASCGSAPDGESSGALDGGQDQEDGASCELVARYVDADGDGFGTGPETLACDGDAAFASLAGDCDDNDSAINPSAAEDAGDAIDGNCDGAELCFVDSDGDGFSSGETTGSDQLDCLVTGLVPTAGEVDDCDDDDPAVRPGASETCNGVDDDCDDVVDEGVLLEFWTDGDGDGFGNADSVPRLGCAAQIDEVENGGDCVDSDAAIGPDATEVCDGLDNDCDGTVDLDAVDRVERFADLDGDGFGSGGVIACADDPAASDQSGDCDDQDADVFPDATERDGVGVDANCDGQVVCYEDFDGDGYRSDRLIASADALCDGPREATVEVPGVDCNDSDRDVYPGALDPVLDGVDQDCSDTPYFEREPYDAYACDEPAEEVCDGVDNDCNGVVDNDFACLEFGIVPAEAFEGAWWGLAGRDRVELGIPPPLTPLVFNALDLEAGVVSLDEEIAFLQGFARLSGDTPTLVVGQQHCVSVYDTQTSHVARCNESSRFWVTSGHVVDGLPAWFGVNRGGSVGSVIRYQPGVAFDDVQLTERPAIIAGNRNSSLVPVVSTPEDAELGAPTLLLEYWTESGELVESYPFEWATSGRLAVRWGSCNAINDSVMCLLQFRGPSGTEQLGMLFDRTQGWRMVSRTHVRDFGTILQILPDGRYLTSIGERGGTSIALRSPSGEILGTSEGAEWSHIFVSSTMMARDEVPPFWQQYLHGGGEE